MSTPKKEQAGKQSKSGPLVAERGRKRSSGTSLGSAGKQPKHHATGQGSRRSVMLFSLGLLLLLSLGAWLTLGIHQVGRNEQAGELQAGDRLLLDQLSAELGRVDQGEVVLVRARTPGQPEPPAAKLRRVVAVEGTHHRGKLVERGHLVLAPLRSKSTRFEQVPVADVLSVARLRIREKGDRWAVDALP